MTRKEIEKKCREEMQQNIPDREALWQKIETRLPEQPVSHPVRRIQMSFMNRAMTAAACFMLVLAGVRFWSLQKHHDMTQENTTPAENIAEADEENIADDYQPDNSKSEPLKYTDLHISQSRALTSHVNYQKLGADGEYFNEDAILAKTEFFIDVKVLDGVQDSETGEMQYTLEVIDVYGGTLKQSEITLKSRSPYILEIYHEYVLPVYYENDWNLVYACAPQIEKTTDDKLIIPNGFYTLMEGQTTPVLYDSYGQDDYFYDRMYLTGTMNLDLLIQKWESL